MATITCPSCKTANPPGVGVCMRCGGSIPLEEPPVQPGSAPLDLAEETEKEIVALLKGGKKIEAIKLCRRKTGQGLKEAHDAVTAIARRHGVAPGKSGCAGVLAAMVGFAAAGWWLARQCFV